MIFVVVIIVLFLFLVLVVLFFMELQKCSRFNGSFMLRRQVSHCRAVLVNQLSSCMYMSRKASRVEVEKEYRRKVTCIPWDLLRRAFMLLASSPEAFLTLRSHFVRTMASVSMCQYVLGIGDRHLSNFMVDMESGGCIGIDFGHAFGTATQVSGRINL